MKTFLRPKIIIIAAIVLAVVLGLTWGWLSERKTERLISEGLAALDAKDWHLASQKLSQARERVPDHPDILYGLTKANVELALEDYRAGRPGFRSRLIQIEPQLEHLHKVAIDRLEAVLIQGDVYLHLDRPRQALEAYREALRRRENSFDAQVGVGRALFALTHEDPAYAPEAIQILQAAVSQRPGAEIPRQILAELYLQQGDLAAAADEIQALLDLGRPMTGETLKTIGKVLFHQGELQAARQYLEQARDLIQGAVNERALVENRYLLGTVCFLLHDFDQARVHLNQAVKSSQQEIYPLLQLAQMLTFFAGAESDPTRRTRQYERALENLVEADKRQPQNPDVLHRLAMGYIRLERFPEARDVLLRLVSLDPGNLLARFDLANLLHQLGDDVQAIRHYQEILQQDPQHGLACYNLGGIFLSRAGFNEAIQYLQRAVQLNPNHLEARLNLAQAYLGRNQNPQAKEQYEKALELAPDDKRILTGLGMIHQRDGDLVGAEQFFRRAITQESTADTAHLLLARLYMQQGDLSGAIRELERVVAVNPRNHLAQIQLGHIYLETAQSANIQKALRLFEGLKTNPSPQISREALTGLALAYLAEGNFEKAQEQFSAILNLPNLSKIDQARIYVNIGNAYLKRNQVRTAREYYENALNLDGTLAEAHYNLGRLHHLQNQLADARRRYMMAVSSDPGMVPAQYNMGLIYEQRNDLEQAAREYQNVIRQDPSLMEGYLNLANIHQRQGRNEEALQLLLNAKTLNPNAKLVRDALGRLYYQMGEFEKVKAEVEYPNPTAQALALQGLLLYRERNYSEAVSRFRQAMIEEGLQPQASTLLNLGAALVQARNYPEAENYLKQALELQDNSIAALNNLGALYTLTGRYLEAEESFEKSLQIQADQTPIRETLDRIRALA